MTTLKELSDSGGIGEPFSPMFPSKQRDGKYTGWISQPRFSGDRIQVHSDGEHIWTFQGEEDVSDSLYQVIDNLQPMFPFILDGIVVTYDRDTDKPHNGESDARTYKKVWFIDCLNHNGTFIHRNDFYERMVGLDDVLEKCGYNMRKLGWDEENRIAFVGNHTLNASPHFYGLDLVWEISQKKGHSGMVLKDPKGEYVSGEDGSWVEVTDW